MIEESSDAFHQQVTFTSRSSNSNTSAIDTLIDQVGVCRDFAHLMIALCRAMNIPARYATGRDAADAAFASIFGSVKSHRPTVQALVIEDAAQGWVRPHHCADALSTDGGPAPESGR